MANIGPEFFSRLPVERLALSLLEQAQANPDIICRGNTSLSAKDRTPVEAGRFPSLALLSDPTFDIRQYLEDLASIAVASAQRAEDTVVHAQEMTRRTRRGMAGIAAFGVLGLLVGAAGFVSHTNTSAKLNEVSGEVRSLEDIQRKAADQLNEIRANTDALDGDVKQAATATAVVAVPVKPLPPQATGYLPGPVISSPWPDSRPYAQHAVVVQRRQTVAAPAFLVAINRGLHTLFR